MKRLLLFIFISVLLFVFSSCYSYSDLNEKLNELDSEWSDRYDELYSCNEDLKSALVDLSEDFATVYCYCEHLDDDITEDEIYDTVERMNSVFNRLGY